MTTVPTANQFRRPFASLGNRFGILPNSRFYGPQGHRGQDFKARLGDPVPAVGAAIVEDVVWSTALGNVVILRHNPPTGPDVFSFSCHLSRTSVRRGQAVKLGQTIGKAGSTGTASSGPHLHLAMSHTSRGGITGEVFDPLAFIDQHDTPAVAAAAGKARYTPARRGEGLSAIASRMRVPVARVIALNASTVHAPEYIVRLGQRIRYA